MKYTLLIPLLLACGVALLCYSFFAPQSQLEEAPAVPVVAQPKMEEKAPPPTVLPPAAPESFVEDADVEVLVPVLAAPAVEEIDFSAPVDLDIIPEVEPAFPPAPENARLNKDVQDLVYCLPTENEALYEEAMEDFFMYCDRIFEGETSRPWTAGRFGFVRNAYRLSTGEIMCSKLHEGIDISPIYRDAKDEPLDIVRAVAKGKVVHVNAVAGRSNYGRYVVVSHDLPEGTFYSLYAHLYEVHCKVGDVVDNQSDLGRMGYSGVGLNKRRAHLHLEFCFMINSHYSSFAPASNYHGNYNGLNLLGLNMEDVLLASRGEKPVSIADYLNTQEELYRIRVPNTPQLDLIKRYPFLLRGDDAENAPSLDIAFTCEGIPLAAYASDEVLKNPRVLQSKPMPTLLQNCTSNRLKNNSKNPQFTSNGLRFIQTFTQGAK